MTGTGGAATSTGPAMHRSSCRQPDKLVYSAHDYGPGVYEQQWFYGAEFPEQPARYLGVTLGLSAAERHGAGARG